jgi:hypothetical protein
MRSGKMERSLQTDGAVGSMDVSGCQLVFCCLSRDGGISGLLG